MEGLHRTPGAEMALMVMLRLTKDKPRYFSLLSWGNHLTKYGSKMYAKLCKHAQATSCKGGDG